MSKEKPKILLTGGRGFIGRNILESHLAQEYEIFAPKSCELDLTDAKEVNEFFADKFFDAVLHTSCVPAHCPAELAHTILYSNLRMFYNLLENKDSYSKFINFSSGAIYSVKNNIANVSEDERFKKIPEGQYDFGKYVISDKIQSLDNFVDLIFFGVFGKHELWTRRFISNAICRTLFDMPITLRQNRRFSYLDVNDLISIVDIFIKNNPKQKCYNIVPDKYIELSQIANIIKEVSGKDIEIKIANEGLGLDYYADNFKLVSEFNPQFTPIKESIEQLYQWYKQNINNIDKDLL